MKRPHLLPPLAALFALALAASAAAAQVPGGKKYPFAKPPLEAFDRLAEAVPGGASPFNADDRAYLAAFWAARTAAPPKALPQADDAAVAAHLIASGIEGPKARVAYLEKFARLVEGARAATAGAKSDGERADLLLRFLHAGAMAKGYEAHHTSLAQIFDTGKYNCVSSSAVYFLVGTRLGLKLEPILVPSASFMPGHAAVDLLDGARRVEVEPTDPDGYDSPAKLKRPGVAAPWLGVDRKKGYASDGFGLAASAASNLALAAIRAEPPRRAEALRLQAAALSFAPTDPIPQKNLLSAVLKWGVKLTDGKDYEGALKVYACARAGLGAQKEVENNYRVTWTRYLDGAFDAGAAGGAKLLARAAAAFPGDKDYARPAEWVARAGRRLADKPGAGWPAALAHADAALADLTGDDAKAVRAWKDTARRLWSKGLLAKGDVVGSWKAIADGLAADPASKVLSEGLAAHAQGALRYLDTEKGTAAAIAHFEELRKAYPGNAGLRECGADHARRAVDGAAKGDKFAEALKVADAYAPLAGDRLADIKGDVYDAWARSLKKAGRWEEGLAKYLEGLAACPGDSRLGHNATALIDGWARAAMDRKDWAEAVRVYDLGLKHFPKDGHLAKNRTYCAAQK